MHIALITPEFSSYLIEGKSPGIYSNELKRGDGSCSWWDTVFLSVKSGVSSVDPRIGVLCLTALLRNLFIPLSFFLSPPSFH